MSLTHRKLRVTFLLQGGAKFPNSDSNLLTIQGLRISATVQKMGGKGMASALMRIYGLSPSLMQQIATYGVVPNQATATYVQLDAGDDSGYALVHVGFITAGWANFNQSPDVAFNLETRSGYFDAIKPVAPCSYDETADAADIMSALAKKMGYIFENNGVSVKLSDPYFWSSARVQAEECARAANINWVIEDGVLAIWPKGGYRHGKPTVISPTTGMVGFPTFTLGGIVVKALLNPTIRYGSLLEVQSSLKPAYGQWTATNMIYELQSKTPNGQWFMTVTAYKPNYVQNS